MTLKVQFSGSLLEMKHWLAEMPDNLAAVFFTSFEASTSPSNEQQARDAAGPFMAQGHKIAAIKAVRTWASGRLAHEAHVRGMDLRSLKGAKDFVESVWVAHGE